MADALPAGPPALPAPPSHAFGTPLYQALAGVCAWSALLVTCYQIAAHLRSYTQPTYQRYIVRIVFMVPFYAVSSFFSLVFQSKALYFATVRDCYEAWVIYNFLALCLAYVGGPGRVEVAMAGYALAPSVRHCTCCLPPMPVNGRFVRACKRGALQFVLVKPVLAAATIAAAARGGYEEGDWRPGRAYLWLTLLYNATYTVALYALLLFYMGTADLLAPFRPVAKFVLVKAVVFATFWQGLAISIAVGAGGLPSPRAGANLQNFIICLEMLPASLGMLAAFPASEYGPPGGRGAGGLRGAAAAVWGALTGRGRGGGGGAADGPSLPTHAAGPGPAARGAIDLQSMRHAFSIRDVVADTLHQFAPAYQDYVLYAGGDGGGGGGGGGGHGGGGNGVPSPAEAGSPGAAAGKPATPRTVVRTTTFLAVGAETTASRLGRSPPTTTSGSGEPAAPVPPAAPLLAGNGRGGPSSGGPGRRSDAPAWLDPAAAAEAEAEAAGEPGTVPAVSEKDDDADAGVLGGLRAAGGLDALDLIAAGATAPPRRASGGGGDGGGGGGGGGGSVPAVADAGLASTRLGSQPGARPGGGGGGAGRGAGLVRELSDDLVEDGGGGEPSGGFRDVAL